MNLLKIIITDILLAIINKNCLLDLITQPSIHYKYFQIKEGSTLIDDKLDVAKIHSYIRYMADSAKLFGADVNLVYQEAIDVIAFESDLSKVCYT